MWFSFLFLPSVQQLFPPPPPPFASPISFMWQYRISVVVIFLNLLVDIYLISVSFGYVVNKVLLHCCVADKMHFSVREMGDSLDPSFILSLLWFLLDNFVYNFVLHSHTMHELCNQKFQLVSSLVENKQLSALCFLYGPGQKKWSKTYMYNKEICLVSY